MKYHKIAYDNMLNGNGLRAVVWVSGCNKRCKGCFNPQTWDINNGKLFTDEVKEELFRYLDHDYIDGLTISGGDPLHEHNLFDVRKLICEVKEKFPDKTVWLYTGDVWEEEILPCREKIKTLLNVDVVVDGRFEIDKADVNCPHRGSTNQRLIDVKKSLELGEVVEWQEK